MSIPVKTARIYLSEGDKSDGENVYKTILSLLHDTHGVQGMTVYRGVAGFGSGGEVHSSDLLHLSAKLPLVIEFFDTVERVDAAIADVSEHVPAGRILCWTGEGV